MEEYEMRLTYEEERMLSGDEGELVRESMRFLVALGEAFDAEKMVDITYANILLASSFWGKGTLTRELIEKAVEEGARVKVPSTFNNWGLGCPSTPESIWETMAVHPKAKEQVLFENRIAQELGIIPTWTCAPYLICDTGWFPIGSHISTAESSAIVYFNSVLGARSNRDCVASFFAAITGKYPKCGFHLDENRHAVYQFDVEAKMDNPLKYGLLGLFAGKHSGMETPVFNGLPRPRTEDLTELSAALASSGGVTMFHITGVTPEAPDLQTALGGKQPLDRIIVTDEDLAEISHSLCSDEGKVDFICLGCPHYSIYQLQEVARLLDGKKVNGNVTMWVCTSPQNAMFAEMAGYARKIEDAGAIIMSGPNFCPLFGPGKPSPEYTFAHPDYSVGAMATDAAKQAYYAKPNLKAQRVFLGTREECIEAAISGEWRKK
jgi:predicted aconitase